VRTSSELCCTTETRDHDDLQQVRASLTDVLRISEGNE
jgi:hypothetical protein